MMSNATAETLRHVPVMGPEMLSALAPRDGEIHVDCTFGAGGYARAILDAADTRVYALDRDAEAIEGGAALVAAFPGRLTLIHGRFAEMEMLLARLGVTAVDGVVFDIGVSSMQLDEARRGFSFAKDGPLDMRMGQEGESAADIVNEIGLPQLARIIGVLGEEKKARRIAQAIERARAQGPIQTTRALADIVERAIGRRPQNRIHPATRTFQALRIHVNRELEELARGLSAAERLLKPGGRLAVVSFHSLEDRISKRFLALRSATSAGLSRHVPAQTKLREPSFTLPFKGHKEPDAAEIAANPRARSAKLRGGIRTSALPWPLDLAELAVPCLDERGR